MFLPSAHPSIEKIHRITLIAMGKESAPAYEFRSQVVMHLNSKIQGVDECLDEDMAVILAWFEAHKSVAFWMNAKKKMDAAAMCDYILENAESDVAMPSHQMAIASETELEDAQNVAESINFTGSDKQIKWAKDIAIKATEAIAASKLSISQIPTSAKWWIDNRYDISSALKAIK